MTLDVKGVEEEVGKSDQEGFSCVLVDTKDPRLLIAGTVAVPFDFGEIESAILLVSDDKGELIARCVMGQQAFEGKTWDFEFNLKRDLIMNSLVLLSHRDGDDLFVAKVHLGTFAIVDIEDVSELTSKGSLPDRTSSQRPK